MEVPNNLCPICKTETQVNENSDSETYSVDCSRCGKYRITEKALVKYDGSDLPDKINSLSYWIRKHQTEEKIIYIDLSLMRSLLVEFEAPKPKEQADNLLLWMGENVTSPEEMLKENFYNLISIIGANNTDNVRYIIQYLIDNQLITSSLDSSDVFQGYLTMDGWDRYDVLQRLISESTTAFMAMKFGIEETDNLFKNILKPAVEEVGFELKKLEDNAPAGLIDNRLRVEIRKAKFLIADLTHDNPGAYFESGFAEGLGKPVLYICEKSKFENDKTHFDTNHHLTLKWDVKNLDDFKEQLKATIRTTFPEDAKMED